MKTYEKRLKLKQKYKDGSLLLLVFIGALIFMFTMIRCIPGA